MSKDKNTKKLSPQAKYNRTHRNRQKITNKRYHERVTNIYRLYKNGELVNPNQYKNHIKKDKEIINKFNTVYKRYIKFGKEAKKNKDIISKLKSDSSIYKIKAKLNGEQYKQYKYNLKQYKMAYKRASDGYNKVLKQLNHYKKNSNKSKQDKSDDKLAQKDRDINDKIKQLNRQNKQLKESLAKAKQSNKASDVGTKYKQLKSTYKHLLNLNNHNEQLIKSNPDKSLLNRYKQAFKVSKNALHQNQDTLKGCINKIKEYQKVFKQDEWLVKQYKSNNVNLQNKIHNLNNQSKQSSRSKYSSKPHIFLP